MFFCVSRAAGNAFFKRLLPWFFFQNRQKSRPLNNGNKQRQNNIQKHTHAPTLSLSTRVNECISPQILYHSSVACTLLLCFSFLLYFSCAIKIIFTRKQTVVRWIFFLISFNEKTNFITCNEFSNFVVILLVFFAGSFYFCKCQHNKICGIQQIHWWNIDETKALMSCVFFVCLWLARPNTERVNCAGTYE